MIPVDMIKFRASNQIEEESHFLIYCNKYSILRNKFYEKIEHIIPTFKQLSSLQAISKLMTSSNHYINILLTTDYILSCFDLRNILLLNSNQCNLIATDIITLLYDHDNCYCFSFSL